MNTNHTSRFYPSSHAACLLLGCDVPGTVLKNKDPKVHPPDVTPATVTIHTTPEQDKLMQQLINDRTKKPSNYNLRGRNCTRFIEDVLNAGKVPNVLKTQCH